MQKQQFIELIKISLTGGDPGLKNEAKYHDEVLALHIGIAFNALVSEINNPRLIEQFTIEYNDVPVLGTVEKYSDLPTTPLTTNYFSGIRAVFPKGSGGVNQFYKRTSFSKSVWQHLEVNNLYTQLAYRQTGQKIVYDKINVGVSFVDIFMLVPFEQLNDTDNITMPGGKDSDVFRLVQSQLEMQYQTPQSQRTDNDPNTK